MQVKDSDANHQPRGEPQPELSAHGARPGEAPASTASAAQDPKRQSPREPRRPRCWDKSTTHPGSCLHLGWGPGPLHSGWGSCTPGCGPQDPRNQQPPHPISALLRRKTPTLTAPVLFLGHSSGGCDPSGSFPPSFGGAPCLSLPRSPLASRQPHAQPVTDGQAGRLGAPALAPSPLASPPRLPGLRSPAQLQELSCPHGSSTGQRFSCGMRSPTLQAGTLLLPLTEASPLLGSLAPLPAHSPALPQEVLRKHRLPTAVRRHKSSSQNIASATTLSW